MISHFDIKVKRSAMDARIQLRDQHHFDTRFVSTKCGEIRGIILLTPASF